MKQRRTSTGIGSAFVILLTAVFAPGLHGWQAAQAAATPISTQPIFITPASAAVVKPNILMVLDDSGSMAWEHMPDTVDKWARVGGNGSKKYGYVSSQCNGIYYNPNLTYAPPVDSAGNSYPASSFTAAFDNGYATNSPITDLSAKFLGWSGLQITSDNSWTVVNDDSQNAAYYYTYKGTVTTDAKKRYDDPNSVFYKECNSVIGSTTAVDGTTPVNQLFTRVTVSSTSGPGSTDERTNFANWYSYYRSRMSMMKSATTLAFQSIDDKFRVGFMKINDSKTADFLNIGDFTQTQKDSFYAKLVASSPGGGTPLRQALSNAGLMYAGKLTSTPDGASVTDPVQYSCQQNYTILSTDGYWNGSGGVKLDASTSIGNEDGALPRPYFDGATSQTDIVTTYALTQDRQGTKTTTTNNLWGYFSGAPTLGASCSYGPPANAVQSLDIGNSRTGALGLSSTNPNSNRCYGLGGGAWFCRSGSSSAPPVSNSAVTDAYGRLWQLVSPLPAGSGSGCVTASTAFGWSYSSTAGVCPSVNGQIVTNNTTPTTQTEVITSSASVVDHYVAQQTTTQTITNGVAASVGPLTPSTPSYGYDSTLSSSAGTVISDTCGGKSAPCPSSSGTWTSGTSISSVCASASTIAAWPTSKGTAALLGTAVATSLPSYTVVASSGPTATGTTSTNYTSGGTSDMLADASAYYYNTALRSTALGNCTPSSALNNLCTDAPPTATTDDPATWQHMTTFTLGLGVRGKMVYSSSYPLDAEIKTASDYTDVYYGNNATSATTCTWRDTLTTAGAACNWPLPAADTLTAVDDLWHTAVNGHGKYYAATDPGKLASGLAQTLKFIVDQPKPGTAASAATTNPKVTENSNYQFSSFFLSVEWSGDLIRQTKDLTTGKPPVFDLMKRVSGTYDWSSREQLDAQNYASRTIYTKGSTGLIPFTWADLGTAGLQSYFTASNISTAPPTYPNQLTGLSQFCSTGSNCISSTAQTNTTVATGGAAGEALVNFLRGDRSNEEGTTPDNSKFFRHRTHVLGDIVSAQPQYSGVPKWSYSDSGYAAFKTNNASRLPLVFAAANDGMLHAFNAGTGAEVWAYIPSFVLPRVYTLADKQYSDKHQYFVEGTPQIADVCPKAPATCSASDWKTILVGGLNAGGTGYYALDITNPTSPQLLWEFRDDNMGYTFGNPQIAKLDDGTWAVMVTSGYDNCPKSSSVPDCARNAKGDGRGYLYVLNAGTGVPLASISTGVGSTTAPSGLGKIVAHVDATQTSRSVYGGDLYGNLWHFTIGSAGYTVQRLATLLDVNGVGQPIMAKPQVTTVNSLPVVYVGTGRYLSTSDVGGTQDQSFYAIKDKGSSYGSPRASGSFLLATAVPGTCPPGTDISVCSPGDAVRTLQQNVGNSGDSLVNKDGWILDFPAGAGELEFTDPKLALGTIAFTTSIPNASTSTSVCTAATNPSEGTSFLYMVNYITGGAVGNANGVAGSTLGSGIATSPQLSVLDDGRVIVTTRMSGGNDRFNDLRRAPPVGAARRVSWRELVSE